ncbi:MAG: ABC transporter ATP-binding protein [Desulfovibrionales bacterium]|nr:ABC transporter ATP-binding protein [Desulfovibrionales bacterium]
MIQVSQLSFAYSKKHPVLRNLNFIIEPGEIINILGPNGCGKSTLLKAILGFLPLKRGLVHINGHDVVSLRPQRLARLLSYVPQMHNTPFNYQVLDVVLMGRVFSGPWYKYTREDHDIARDALHRVRLLDLASRPYQHLSGGQRQLVLIARALAQGADYFIMDEPVTGLDYSNQFYLLETIRELSAQGGAQKTGKLIFILTTHHPEHALFLGGRALLIQKGQLLADGPVEAVVTAQGICDLYGIKPQFLDKIINSYGKQYGMAC